MPAPEFTQHDLGSVAISGANSASFVPFMPTRILRAYAIITTAITVANTSLLMSIEQADGTDTTPTGVGAAGSMVLTPALGILNAVFYSNLDETVGDLIVMPGERFTILSNGGSTAGAARLGLIIQPLGLANVDYRSHVVSHPGSTDLPTALAGAIKLT